ncbi:Hypothetical predicted protein [Marmota monax]|uniref:Uncharacterized protein n=1 Tax=Marmota monax TaxID=9995 RepID=A0A5E4D641_MARMO|nr:Hypothetical predicted protein [Marmota monax]
MAAAAAAMALAPRFLCSVGSDSGVSSLLWWRQQQLLSTVAAAAMGLPDVVLALAAAVAEALCSGGSHCGFLPALVAFAPCCGGSVTEASC